MYLVAQRVMAPNGAVGINAFRYAHPNGIVPPEPEPNPGVLVHMHVAIPAGTVRSYMDILTPEGTSAGTLTAVLANLPWTIQPQVLPWCGRVGAPPSPFWVRIYADQALATAWRSEFRALFAAALGVL